MVYPLRNAMDIDSITVKAFATDEDGAGRSSSVDLTIKKLESKHITILSVENAIQENIETILKHIETSANVELKVLNSAVVSIDSNADEATFSLRALTMSSRAFFNYARIKAAQSAGDKLTILRMVVYAFDTNDIPIDTETLKE